MFTSSRRRRRLGRSRDIVTQVEGSVGVQCLKSTSQGCCSVGCLGSTADWGGVGGGLQLIRQDGLQVGRLKVCPRVLSLLLQDTSRWVGCCQVACHDLVGIQLGLLGLPQHCGGRCRPSVSSSSVAFSEEQKTLRRLPSSLEPCWKYCRVYMQRCDFYDFLITTENKVFDFAGFIPFPKS